MSDERKRGQGGTDARVRGKGQGTRECPWMACLGGKIGPKGRRGSGPGVSFRRY